MGCMGAMGMPVKDWVICRHDGRLALPLTLFALSTIFLRLPRFLLKLLCLAAVSHDAAVCLCLRNQRQIAVELRTETGTSRWGLWN